MAGANPLFVLGRVALTALLGPDEFVGQVKDRLQRETVGDRGVAVVLLGVGLSAAELDKLLLTVAYLVFADQPSRLLILEEGVIF